MATSPRFTKTIVAVPAVVIPTANAGVLTTIYAANATYDSRITGIVVTSTDTSAQTAKLYINDGSTDVCIGWVSIGIAAGNSLTVSPVGMMASLPASFRELDENGVSILNLPKGSSLKIAIAAITADKTFSIWTKAELYD